MVNDGRADDERFQGSLNAEEPQNENAPAQPGDEQNLGLDLGSILGGLMGGGQTDQMGAQAGGLDLGSLLGGLLGGGMMGGASDVNSQMGGMSGMGGGLDGILGGVAGDLSAKTGLPREIIMMGAMFLISKLMSGGLGGNQEQGGQQQAGGLDLGTILGGLLGGGGLPGMEQGLPQQDAGGINTPQQGEVLGKIGKQINDGLNSPHLTAGGLQQSGLASEFSQMSGLSEDEAAQSLNQIVGALKQSGFGQ